jgi:tetratricopeptide (TPR) repeat protein
MAGAAALLLVVLNMVWLAAAEHGDRARAALQQREAGTAVEEYRVAAALAPLDAELRVEMASALASVGDNEGAVAACRRAAELAPTWGRPYHRLGRLYERMGRLRDAERAFEAAAARDPRNTQPLDALAQIRAALGDEAGALQAHRQIIALAESGVRALDSWTDPIPAGSYEALGREAEGKGSREEALRLYRLGAGRLRQWRLERPFRLGAKQARGEGASTEREVQFQRVEVRLWERLAALYAQAGKPAEGAEARQEVEAAKEALGTLQQEQSLPD